MARITLFIQPGFQVEGRPRCFSGTPYAIKIQRLLQYKRVSFDVREVGWLERGELLPKISQSRKLPVLAYDDQLIEDSTAIAYYLEDLHPEPRVIPQDPVLRARSHFLEEWADEVLYWYSMYELARFGELEVQAEAYFRELPQEVQPLAVERMRSNVEENLDRQGVGRYPPEKVQADLRRGLDALEALVQADAFAVGPAPSLADFALFGQIHRRLAGTHRWFEGEVAARPSIGEWLARVDRCTEST